MTNNCKHLNKHLKVLETFCTIEITVVVCADCKKELEPVKHET